MNLSTCNIRKIHVLHYFNFLAPAQLFEANCIFISFKIMFFLVTFENHSPMMYSCKIMSQDET